MRPEEKFCPITKMTCKGSECALFMYGACAVITLAEKAEDIAQELYTIRKDIER